MFELRAARSSAFWTITALAASAHIIVAAIVIRLTTTTISSTHLNALGMAASVFEVFSLGLLLLTVATRRLRARRTALTIFYSFAAVFNVIAAFLSVYLLGWTVRHMRDNDSKDLASAGLALWAVLALLLGVFYTYLLWPQKGSEHDMATELIATERPSLAKRSLSVHLTYLRPTAPPFVRSASEPHSPTLSRFSASPRSPWRESVHQSLRPMTSKSRLLRHSLQSSDARSHHSGRPVSLDTLRQHDGFETWDTSALEDVPDTPRIPQEYRYRLETIPGSRPASPAKALDGPFPAPRTPEEVPLPESPKSLSAETGSLHDLQHMPSLRRPSTHESHIHPLFRSESPNPPPMPSPGTVVTASPLAGQVVSPEHAMGWTLHSTQIWRPGSTMPVSPTGSRSGSVRSLRLQASSAVEPLPSSPLHDRNEASAS